MMKKFFAILLAVLTLCSVSALSVSAKTEVESHGIRLFCQKEFTETKKATRKFESVVKYNDKKYLGVHFKDNGTSYSLVITARKVTPKQSPVVKVFYRNSKNKVVIVKRYRFVVRPLGTVSFSDVKLNQGVTAEFTVNNPFVSKYTFELSDAKVAHISKAFTENGIRRVYRVYGKRLGSTKVEVYERGQKAGEFTLTVGDFPTEILPKYSEVTLKYCPNGSSVYMSESHLQIQDALTLMHKADYSVTIDDETAVSSLEDGMVYATDIGEADVTVIESIDGNEKVVGVIKFTCVKAKMSYVVKQNSLFYDTGVFGNGDSTVYLDKGDKLKAMPVIKERLLNNTYTGSSFKKSEYKAEFSTSDKTIAAVDSDGVVTAKKAGKARIYYTLTFSDKSTYRSSFRVINSN